MCCHFSEALNFKAWTPRKMYPRTPQSVSSRLIDLDQAKSTRSALSSSVSTSSQRLRCMSILFPRCCCQYDFGTQKCEQLCGLCWPKSDCVAVLAFNFQHSNHRETGTFNSKIKPYNAHPVPNWALFGLITYTKLGFSLYRIRDTTDDSSSIALRSSLLYGLQNEDHRSGDVTPRTVQSHLLYDTRDEDIHSEYASLRTKPSLLDGFNDRSLDSHHGQFDPLGDSRTHRIRDATPRSTGGDSVNLSSHIQNSSVLDGRSSSTPRASLSKKQRDRTLFYWNLKHLITIAREHVHTASDISFIHDNSNINFVRCTAPEGRCTYVLIPEKKIRSWHGKFAQAW